MSDASLHRLRERFEADPTDTVAFEALEERHFLHGDWNELVVLYEKRLGARDLAAERHPEARARLALRLGQVLEERCLELDRAVERYEEVARLDPSCRQALVQLRSVYAKRGQWELTLQVAELEARLPMRPFEQAAFCTELGRIWLEKLGDAAQAMAHFDQALAADPHHVPALLGAARAAEAQGDARTAAGRLEQAAARLRGPDRAPVLVTLARVSEGALGDPAAAAALYRRALADDPRHEEALRALAERAREEAQWPLYDELTERRFSVAAGASRRVAIAREAARVQLDAVRNPQGARHWLARALELYPEDASLHAMLADVERLSGHPDALAQHLDRVLELAGDQTPLEVLRERAALARAGGDDATAADRLRRALVRQPEEETLLAELAEVLGRLGRHDELVEILEQQAELCAEGSPQRLQAWLRLARVHEERTGDAEAALEVLERAADADPGHPDVIAPLERMLRKAEDFGRLRAHLERAVAATAEDAERGVALRCALAELVMKQVGDLDEARRGFDAALAMDPACRRARQGLERIALASGDEAAIVDAFEREADVTTERDRLAFLVWELVRIFEGRGETERALRWTKRLVAAAPGERRALETCARLEEALGQADALRGTLEQLDAVLQGEEQAALRRRLAALAAAAGDAEGCITWYRAALDADPSDRESLRGLLGPLTELGHTRERAEVLAHLVEISDGPERAGWRRARAILLEEELGDLPAAARVWEALADETGADADTAHEAAARLEALLERMGEIEPLLARWHGRRGALADGCPEAVALDLRMGELLGSALRRPREAAGSFRRVLEQEPEHPIALAGLERALREAGDSAALLAFLESRAGAERDPEARARLDLERAALHEAEPEGEARARELLAALADGDSAVAAEAETRLDAILERAGAWETTRDRLLAKLGAADAEVEVGLRLRLAALCRDRLIDPDAAIEHLERAAELAPSRADVWQALARLYQEEERAADWVGALEAELASGPDPERALTLHARAAALCRQPLGDAERAGRHYRRILELEPSHAEAAEFLAEHLAEAGQDAELTAVLETRLAALPPHEVAAGAGTALRLRIAALRAGPLRDVDGAIEVLEAATGDEAALLLVAEPLADLYTRAGRTDRLVELARRAVTCCEAPEERAGWSLRLADALRAGGDLEASAEAYRQVLVDRPEDRAAPAALRELYRRLGEAAPLARLLEAELGRLGGSAEIAPRLELAELLAETLGRPAEALRHLRRVLEVDAGHGPALARALALAEALDARDDWLALAELALARTPSPSERAALLVKRGRLLAGPLGRAEDAAASLREALRLDPGAAEARATLLEVLRAAGDVVGVLGCLEQEVASAGAADPARAEALCQEALALAAAHLPPDASLPWLERLRRLRPGDPSVVTRIAALHRDAGRAEPLLRALEEEIALGPGAERRVVLERERAAILEQRLGAPGRAILALEAARRCDPHSIPVLRELDRLYAAAGRHAERAAVLQVLIGRIGGDERLALRRAAADLAERLGRPEDAAAQLYAALAEPSVSSLDRVELLRGLAAVVRSQGREDLWARVAEEELRRLDPEAPVFLERRVALHQELARVYTGSLGRPDAAAHHLRMLLDRGWLRPDGDGRTAYEAAEAALLVLLERSRGVVERERRLSARLDRLGDATPADAWLELGRLRLEALHRPAAAALAFRRALQTDPASLAAVRGLRQACERLGRFAEVAETLEREAELRPDAPPTERAALWRRLGQVTWLELDSTTRASRAFAAALEASPGDLPALRSLQELFETMEDFRGALDLYESEVSVLGESDPARRREAWLRAGALADTRTGEPERALRAYEAAAQLGALPAPALRAQAELHQRLGHAARFAETFAAWCDDPEAGAGPDDALRLAEALVELGRRDEARARLEAAVAATPGHAPAWDALASLHEEDGRAAEAAEALERAASSHAGGDAAERCARAAAWIEAAEPERAAALLDRAVADDPGHAGHEARRARVLARVGRHVEAAASARRALGLAAPGALPADERLATALAGAGAARAAGDLEGAALLLDAALAVDGDHAEALAAAGDVRFALGDLPGARRALERRLAQDTPDPDRALHLAQLAETLAAAGEADAAVGLYREALGTERGLEMAHAGLVDVLVRQGRRADAVEALRAWASCPGAGAERGVRLLRAAELERAAGRGEAAEGLLREATAVPEAPAGAWALLARLLWDADRAAEALEQATAGLAAQGDDRGDDAPDPDRAELARVRALALERRGDARGAARAFADAARLDPRDRDAALAGARLLRGLGEWREAADGLRRFVAAAPADEPARVAPVLHQLGRLLAGPLEDVEGAIGAYRRALDVDPDEREAREALAELLVHRPELWDEAVARHRELLQADPCRLGSIRALVRIARGRGSEIGVASGLALLRALGAATPDERAEAPARPAFRLGRRVGFDDPVWEAARRVAGEAAAEVAEALGVGAPAAAGDAGSASPVARFRSAVTTAEAELSAPALVPLPTPELGRALALVCALAAEADAVEGEAHLVNALSAALGRRARRRVRRALGDVPAEAVARIDFAAWRAELRGIASAAALDAGEADLRTALLAWLDGEDELRALPAEADLRARVAASPEAMALLRRLVGAWVDAL